VAVGLKKGNSGFFGYFIVLFFCVLHGGGCTSAPTKEKKIPDRSLSEVQKLEGVYRGDLKLQTTDGELDQPLQSDVTVKLSLEGNSLKLEASTDIAGAGCNSRIGKLKSLSIFGKDDNQVIQGYFEFDRNLCKEKIKSDELLFIAKRPEEGDRLVLDLYLTQDYVKTRLPLGKRPLNIQGHLTEEQS
jgi:hypothetical protein